MTKYRGVLQRFGEPDVNGVIATREGAEALIPKLKRLETVADAYIEGEQLIVVYEESNEEEEE